jgi:hypothetical protein
MKTMTHPEVGPLRIECDVLTIPEDDQQVVFMTAEPGTASPRRASPPRAYRISR